MRLSQDRSGYVSEGQVMSGYFMLVYVRACYIRLDQFISGYVWLFQVLSL
jgi:hypothetical protein